MGSGTHHVAASVPIMILFLEGELVIKLQLKHHFWKEMPSNFPSVRISKYSCYENAFVQEDTKDKRYYKSVGCIHWKLKKNKMSGKMKKKNQKTIQQ